MTIRRSPPWNATVAAVLLLGAGACSSAPPTLSPDVPAASAVPASPSSATPFTIGLPVRPGDVAYNAYGLVPFGVHIGDHGSDGHPGWDFEYAPGASVYAAAAGVVQSVMPSGNGTGFGIQITHDVAGTKGYRTIYGVGTLATGITAGAPVAAGQALGVADVFTRTIGRTTVTFAMTHFQLDDFSSNGGQTNTNAVSPDRFLSAASRQSLDSLWREASYTQELVEPFLSNPRDVVFPLTRVWTRETGNLTASFEVSSGSAQATSYTYALRDSAGTVVETGTLQIDALAKPFPMIDLLPSAGGPARRGLFRITGGAMQLEYGTPGAERPADLAAAATYRTS